MHTLKWNIVGTKAGPQIQQSAHWWHSLATAVGVAPESQSTVAGW